MSPFVLYPLLAIGSALHLPEALGAVLFRWTPALVNVWLALLWARRRASKPAASVRRRSPAERLASSLRPTRVKALAIGYVAAVAALGARWTDEGGGPYVVLSIATAPLGVILLLAPFSLYPLYAVPALLPGATSSEDTLTAPYASLFWATFALGNVGLVARTLRSRRAGRPLEFRYSPPRSRSGPWRGHHCRVLVRSRP